MMPDDTWPAGALVVARFVRFLAELGNDAMLTEEHWLCFADQADDELGRCPSAADLAWLERTVLPRFACAMAAAVAGQRTALDCLRMRSAAPDALSLARPSGRPRRPPRGGSLRRSNG